jgi:hypothetical protein
MITRDFAVVALGRFLVVERYRETCLPSSTNQVRSPRPDRTGGHAGSSSGSRAPARPQHG